MLQNKLLRDCLVASGSDSPRVAQSPAVPSGFKLFSSPAAPINALQARMIPILIHYFILASSVSGVFLAGPLSLVIGTSSTQQLLQKHQPVSSLVHAPYGCGNLPEVKSTAWCTAAASAACGGVKAIGNLWTLPLRVAGCCACAPLLTLLRLLSVAVAAPFMVTLPAAYALWVFCRCLLWRIATDQGPPTALRKFLAWSAAVYLACIDIYKDVVICCAAAVGRWAVDWLCTAAATFIAVAWWTQGQSRSRLLDFVITTWRCTAFAAWMALFGVKVQLQDDEGEMHAKGVGGGGGGRGGGGGGRALHACP